MYNLAKVGGIVVLIGGTFTYSAYDKAVNYHEVTARVARVTGTCYLTKRTSKHRMDVSETMPCHTAEQTARHHPSYQGYNVRYTFDVQLLYIVPGEKRTQQGHLSIVGRKWRGLTRGDVMQVLVDKKEPTRIRRL